MLNIDKKKYRNLQEQVCYNAKQIDKIFSILDGIDYEDHVVVIEDISIPLTEEEMDIVNEPVAFLVYQDKLYFKDHSDEDKLYFSAVVDVEGSSLITINVYQISVDNETRALDLLNNTKEIYSSEEVDGQILSLENLISTLGDGSPKGVYSTLADLETAYPTGAEGIYVVSGDGHWYFWNGAAWTDGGVYLNSGDQVLYALKDSLLKNLYKNNALIGLSDEVTTTTCNSTSRWFEGKIIPKGSIITDLIFQDYGAAKNVTIELWELVGGTLTLVKTIPYATTGTGKYTVEINVYAKENMMISWQSNNSFICYAVNVPANDGNYYLSVISDKVSSSLSLSSLISFPTYNPCITINCLTYLKNNYIITVGEGCDYEEIQEALDNIVDTVNVYTLIVYPKKTPYQRFSMIRELSDPYPWDNIEPRNINIIGLEKEHCVIQSDTGDYRTPPAELMTNGTIKNLTFKMTHDSQDLTATQGGYGAHIDCRTKNDVGYKMVIENCKFESDTGPAVGIGMHQNCELILDNCEFISTAVSSYVPYVGYTNLYDFGCLFCHSSTIADRVNQVFTLKNCIGSVQESSRTLWVSKPASGSPNMYVTLINNVFWNYQTDTPSYSLDNSFTYNPMNFGNNNN